jgi:Protein of unknown function (DUF3800)
MHILFVDESGSPPEREKAALQPFFVLGGIVIPEDIWAKMAGDLARLKGQFKIDGEIKWRYFAPDRGGKAHALSHLSGVERETLRTQLYQAIGRYKSVRLICVVTNTELAYKQAYITTGDDLYWYSYKQLTERFQYYLQDLERTVGQKLNGIVVCDHRGPKDDERLRELHHKLLSSARSTISSYGNMIEGLFIAPSHLSVGIQFADMVAGAVFRAYRAQDTRFAEQIKPAFRTSPKGKFDGYGLVKFPKGW